MHNSDPTPQHLENRNILLLIKCVLTALHVYCMILFDKGLWLKQEENVHLSERVVIQYRERDDGDLFQPHLKYTLTFFPACTSRSRYCITTRSLKCTFSSWFSQRPLSNRIIQYTLSRKKYSRQVANCQSMGFTINITHAQ
jgi:hypothetical protein